MLACKTVVNFCVFQANRGKRKVSVSHAQGDQEPCAWLTLRVIRLALASVRLRHTHTQIQIMPVLQANGLLKASPIFVRFKIALISLRYILHNFYLIHCVSFFIYLKSSFLSFVLAVPFIWNILLIYLQICFKRTS